MGTWDVELILGERMDGWLAVVVAAATAASGAASHTYNSCLAENQRESRVCGGKRGIRVRFLWIGLVLVLGHGKKTAVECFRGGRGEAEKVHGKWK